MTTTLPTTLRRTVAIAVLVGLTIVAGVLALGAFRRSGPTPQRRNGAGTTVRTGRTVRRTAPTAPAATVPAARPVLSKKDAALDYAGGALASKLAPNYAAALARVLPPGDAALGCVPDPHPPVLPQPTAIDPLVCYATGPGGSITVVIATVAQAGGTGHHTVAVLVPPATPVLPGGATVEASS